MISKVMKKMLSIMMAFVLILTSMPVQSYAAAGGTLENGAITVSSEADVTDEVVTLSVAAKENSGCTSTTYEEDSKSATITNTSGGEGILKFSFEPSGNYKSITIDGTTYDVNSTYPILYSKKIAANAKITISVTNKGGVNENAQLKLTAIEFADTSDKNVIVHKPENGTVTVNGTPLTEAEKEFTVSYEEGINLSAESMTGYEFLAWVDENQEVLSQEKTYNLKPTSNCHVNAMFIVSGEACFKVGTRLYDNLSDSIDRATTSNDNLIIPIRDGIVPAGDYTIPNGVTLLVPFDEGGTCYRQSPVCDTSTYVAPTVFRKLTLSEGVNLTVNGEISVSAKHKDGTGGGLQGAAPSGPCGFLNLMEGSTVTLDNQGALYAWGFVTGEGEIIAKSGSTVYENMQITDYRGGSRTLSMINNKSNKVFPFSQYYVQNIEAPITLEYGATEKALATVTAQIVGTKSTVVNFIGTNGAMFTLGEGASLRKTYEPARDRINYDINGNVTLNEIELSLAGYDVDTKDYNLPITNNISIRIHSGKTTINQNVALLPGGEVLVEEGAEIHVAKDKNVFVYDKSEWGPYTHHGAQFVEVPYPVNKPYKRTVDVDIKDVIMDINGTLTSQGSLYTTESGASIISSKGTGIVQFESAAAGNTTTKQHTQETNPKYVDINVTSAKLKNADGSYTETAGSNAGTYFVYDKTAPGANGKNGKWVKATATTITYNANGGSGEMEAQSYSAEEVKNAILSGSDIKLKANTFKKTEHTFTNWNTEADGSGKAYENEAKLDGYDSVTLYAQWKTNEYDVSFDSKGGSEVAPVTKAFGEALTDLPTPTREGFIFEGWYTVDGDAKVDDSMTMPSGGLNCYAKWNTIQYELEYELDGGSLPEGQMNPEGYNVESDEFTLINPTKEGYTFLGWKEAGSNKVSENVTIAKGTTGDKSYTAQWSVNQYEITFELENGEDAIIIKQDYGTAVTAPEAPTKTGYTFAGWSPELPDTMPAKNITITATWDAIPYQVAFDGNGATSGMMENQAFVYDLAQKLTKNAFGRAYVVNYDYNEGVAGEPTATATAEFKGWSVSKEAASVYGDEASVKNLASEKDAVATLYANWTLGKVTLPTPTREGYDFTGWTTDKAGEGTLYNGTYTPEADTTLYAQWEGKEYVAYFMKTADDENPQTITKKIGEKLCGKNELLPVPSGIKGYKFEGWYTKDGEQAKTSTIMPLNGVTYYAKWTPRTYQVDFFANDGIRTDRYYYKQVGYERPLGTLPTIERAGYTFDGWFTDPVGGDLITPETTMPFEGADYYAQWTPIEYAITYDLDEELVGTGAALPEGTPTNYNIETEDFTLGYPTVEGYTFIGWTGEDIKDPQMNVTISKGTINDKHYTANWEINKHTVTYNALDGSEAETITLEYGQEIPQNELGETVSHTFGGWYITLPTEGNNGVHMPVNMPDMDLHVYANWIEKKEVTLEFDSAGASAVEPQTGYVGAPLTLPADPARSGYTFLGWYNEAGENVSEKENPRYPFDSETYTAKWDVNEYFITYSLNGGELEEGKNNPESYTIEDPDFTLHNPTREGYEFLGWTGSNGRTPSETVTVKTDRISDLAYIANWDALQFTASFDANCDELDNPTSITKDCDAPLGELPKLERRGYTFNGWYDADGDKISSKTTMPPHDATYTAKWTANTYKITYDANGGEGAPRDQKWTYDQEESIFLSAKRPTRQGYYFIGWSEDKAATDADYGSDAEIESTTWAEDVTLYAVWGVTTYGITYVDTLTNTEIIGENPESYTVETPDFTLENPTKEGYHFVGWLEKGETEPKETVTITQGTTGAKLFRLIWTPIDYTISYELDGGVLAEGSPVGYTIESEDITLVAPSKTGYTFAGWTGPNVEEPTTDVTIKTGTIGDQTYTAHWTANSYEVEFVGNGATSGEMANQTFTYDEAQKLTENAFVREYVVTYDYSGGKAGEPTATATAAFEGWEDGDKTYDDKQKVSNLATEGTHKLFAKWTLGSVTLPTPERDGYAFAGWTTDKEGLETVEGTTYVPTEDTTLYAKWIVNNYSVIFDGNKATSGEMSKQPFTYDVEQALTKNAFDRTYTVYFEGYLGSLEKDSATVSATFNGWALNDKGSKVYDDEAVVKNLTDVKDGEVTLYADWTLNAITLPAPERAGYTFAGWSTSEDGSMGEIFQAGDEFTPKASQTLFAKWTINKHTITFDSANGNPLVVIEQYYGTEATVADAPEKEGHTFAGWNTKADGTGTAYEPGDKFELTANVELFAQWTVNQYKLTFDANGGSDVEAIEQDYGTEVTAPADPTRKGYTFAGWDGDIPETMPATDMTFTAKWNINQYTATFDDTEGSGHKETFTQDYDTDVTVPEAPEREGYTFLNWNTKADGTGKDYKPGKTITLEDADITFYAQWSINQYTIKFDTDGGSDVAAMELDYGAEVKAPAEPTKYGYVFAGWEPALPETMPAEDLEVKAKWIELERYTATFTDHNGNTIDVSTGLAGEKIPVPADPVREGYTFAGWTPAVPETYPEANTTYTAQWTVNEYEATFDANGGVEAAPATITKDYAESLGMLPETERTGYTFKGWFTEKTGGTKITEDTTMPAGDVTYYAQWAINTYTIEFDTAGGTAVSKIVQEFATAIRKPAAPSKEGHTFIGWDQEVPETMPAENMKLTAQWKANQYTIVFNTDGGSKVDPITQDYGTAITAPANPTKEGYSFAGWNAEIPTTMPAGNKLIKATWKINQYTIEFDTAGGSEVAPITQDYGTKVTAPADPTRTDYVFAGWSVEIPKTMPAGDMTVTAQWEYIYTGWKTTDEGTTYFENGKQPYKDTFATIDDVTYYFDEDSYIVKGVTELEDGIYLFDQETGEFVEGDGLCEFEGDLYLLDDNKVVENAGLVKIDEDYYFFGEDHKAVKDQMVDVEDTKGYLPAGTYEFGPDGKMINVPVELTEEIVKLKDDSVVYDGTKKKPVVVVKGLDADAYEVTYADNLHAGTATVTVTGVNGCFGTVTLHFEIRKAKNSWTEKLTIEGWTEGEKAQKPFADAQFGDVTYEFYADRNCTEKIAAPKAAGKYFVKAYVEGTEDYTGLESRAVKFIIDEPAKKPSDKPAGGAGGQDNDGNPPSTGDENQLTLWLGLAMASMMGAFSAYRRRRDEI